MRARGGRQPGVLHLGLVGARLDGRGSGRALDGRNVSSWLRPRLRVRRVGNDPESGGFAQLNRRSYRQGGPVDAVTVREASAADAPFLLSLAREAYREIISRQ